MVADEIKISDLKIVALAGGVGGAKLALGFYHYLQNQYPGQPANLFERLAIVGNTGDDMDDYLGLYICPDLDTLMYSLSGLANPATGWGIEGDSNQALQMLARYGHDNWFWLGDRDLATHLRRTQRLSQGARLTEITAELAAGVGITCQLLPMCDQPVRTLVHTVEAGILPFQEYFVRRRATDTVTGLTFQGVEQATISPEVRQAVSEADLILICPSNPYLSIEPILAVPGMRQLLGTTNRPSKRPIVVVSPIVGGQALKGPAAALMRTLGGEVQASALGVARYYAGFASHFVLDRQDAEQEAAIEALGFKVLLTDTIMKSLEDKMGLAKAILDWEQL